MRLADISRRLVASSLAVTLATGSLAAVAQPRHRQEWDGGRHDQVQQGPTRDARNAQRGGPQPGVDMQPGRGAGPGHRYHQGDRLPPEARQPAMVVQDWRDHRLEPPPRGHDWVRLGSDFVLVAAATGIIAQVILSAGR